MVNTPWRSCTFSLASSVWPPPTSAMSIRNSRPRSAPPPSWVLLAFTFIAGPHVPLKVIGVAVVLMSNWVTKQVNIGLLKNSTRMCSARNTRSNSATSSSSRRWRLRLSPSPGPIHRPGWPRRPGLWRNRRHDHCDGMTKVHAKYILRRRRLLQQVGVRSRILQLAALGSPVQRAGRRLGDC